MPIDYNDSDSNGAQYRGYDLPVTMRAEGTGSVSTTIQYWSGGSGSNASVSVYPKINNVNITAGNLSTGRGYVGGGMDLDAEL